MRVVLDTSVLASAARSRSGASNRLVELALTRVILLVATPVLFLEYEEVLTRPEQCIAHGRSAAAVSAFLKDLSVVLEPVEVYYQWRPQMQDADDEMVLEAAINGGAEVLVTHNLRHFRVAGSRFGIRVLQPAELLREVNR